MRHCCNHPYLVAGVEEEEEVRAGGYGSPAAELDALVAASGKTVLLSKLLPHLTAGGHRTLLFSQFKLVLDLLEDVLDHLGLPYERLDGDVTGAARQAAIARFEAPGCTTPVFLLGTRAGAGPAAGSRSLPGPFAGPWPDPRHRRARDHAHLGRHRRAVRPGLEPAGRPAGGGALPPDRADQAGDASAKQKAGAAIKESWE